MFEKSKEFISLSVATELVNQSWWLALKSPLTYILADGLVEETCPVLDETALQTVHKEEDGDW